MIRRQLTHPDLGPVYGLITQDDHARLSGDLARRLGTSRYPKPGHAAQPARADGQKSVDQERPVGGGQGDSFAAFVLATACHDAGWPVVDVAPPLNSQGLPQDVFETSRDVGLRAWSGAPEAVHRAAMHTLTPPEALWAELLVSLHTLSLSALATTPNATNEQFDVASLPERFEINKFQQREIERQERLRQSLGLATDVPLTLGLADEHTAPSEDALRWHLRWLQALDVMSLGVCCTKPPIAEIKDVHPAPGEPGDVLRLRREGDDLLVSPWPFSVERIDLRVAMLLVPARRYASPEDLHAEMARGLRAELTAAVRAY